MGWGYPWYGYRLGRDVIESSLTEKDLGIQVGEVLDMSWQRVLAVEKANCIPGSIKSSVASRLREVILPLCSAFVRHYLEYFVQLWSPQYKKDMDLLEQVQRRTMKMIRGLERLFSEERLGRVGIVQPGEGRAVGRPYCGLSVPKGSL